MAAEQVDLLELKVTFGGLNVAAKKLRDAVAKANADGNADAARKAQSELAAVERVQQQQRERGRRAELDLIAVRKQMAIEAIKDESTRRQRAIQQDYETERKNIQMLLRDRVAAGQLSARKMKAELAAYDAQLITIRDRKLAEVPRKSLLSKAGVLGDALGISAGMLSGAAVTALLGQAVRIGATFEQEMSRVRAAVGGTQADFEALSRSARDLGASTTFSATEAAQAEYELAAAGMSTKDVLASIEGVLDAAAAGQMDLAQTAEIVVGTLGAFNMEADEAQRVADVLAQGSIKAALGIKDIGLSLEYAAPGAHMLGLTLEDTTAALMAMSEANIKGEKAGTALRGGFDQLLTPSDKAAALMKRIGFSVEDASGKMKPMPELIGALSKSLGGMSEVQRVAALSTLVGTEAASGFGAMLTAGQKQIQSYKDELLGSKGAAEELARVMTGNLRGDAEQLSGSLQELGLTFYDVFQADLRSAVQAGTGALDGLIDATKRGEGPLATLIEVIGDGVGFVERWGSTLLNGAKAVAVAGVAVKSFALTVALKDSAVGKAVTTLHFLILGTQQQAAASAVATAATTAQAAATETATVAQQGLNAAMRANVIGMVVSLLASAAAGYFFFAQRVDDGTAALKRQEQAARDLAASLAAATGAQLVEGRQRAIREREEAELEHDAADRRRQELERTDRRYVYGFNGSHRFRKYNADGSFMETDEYRRADASAVSAAQRVNTLNGTITRATERVDRDPTARLHVVEEAISRGVAAGLAPTNADLKALRAEREELQARIRAGQDGPTPRGNAEATSNTGSRARNHAAAEAERVDDARTKLTQKAAQFQAEAVTDSYAQEVAALRARYQKERDEIGDTGKATDNLSAERQAALEAVTAAETKALADLAEKKRQADFEERERVAELADERLRIAGHTDEEILRGRLARLRAELDAEADGTERKKALARDVARAALDVDRERAERMRRIEQMERDERAQAAQAELAARQDADALALLSIENETERERTAIAQQLRQRIDAANAEADVERARINASTAHAIEKAHELARVKRELNQKVADAERDAQREQAEMEQRLLRERRQKYEDLARSVLDAVEASFGKQQRMSEAQAKLERMDFAEREKALKQSYANREISAERYQAELAVLGENRRAFEKQREEEHAGVLTRLSKSIAAEAKQTAIEEIKAIIARAAAKQAEKIFSFIPPPFSVAAAAAAVAATFGVIGMITKAAGFKRGGYTGDGPEDEVAGVVHHGEFVIPAPLVKGRRAEWEAIRAHAEAQFPAGPVVSRAAMVAAMQPALPVVSQGTVLGALQAQADLARELRSQNEEIARQTDGLFNRLDEQTSEMRQARREAKQSGGPTVITPRTTARMMSSLKRYKDMKSRFRSL